MPILAIMAMAIIEAMVTDGDVVDEIIDAIILLVISSRILDRPPMQQSASSIWRSRGALIVAILATCVETRAVRLVLTIIFPVSRYRPWQKGLLLLSLTACSQHYRETLRGAHIPMAKQWQRVPNRDYRRAAHLFSVPNRDGGHTAVK